MTTQQNSFTDSLIQSIRVLIIYKFMKMFTSQVITAIIFVIFLCHVTGLNYKQVTKLIFGIGGIQQQEQKQDVKTTIGMQEEEQSPEELASKEEKHTKKEIKKLEKDARLNDDKKTVREDTDRKHRRENSNRKNSLGLHKMPELPQNDLDLRFINNEAEVDNGQNCDRALAEYDSDCSIQSDPSEAFDE